MTPRYFPFNKRRKGEQFFRECLAETGGNPDEALDLVSQRTQAAIKSAIARAEAIINGAPKSTS